MRESAKKASVLGVPEHSKVHLGTLAVSVIFIISIAGCGEQNLTGTKKNRLIAAENIQLKKQLEQRDKEIEKQKEPLNKHLQEKKGLEERLQKSIPNRENGVLKVVMDELAKQRYENGKLKAQIEQLKKEVEELKKRPKLPDKPQPL